MNQRNVAFRTAGHTRGPITRLASPGDAGELIKPFVFLDRFHLPAGDGGKMGMHPHSGIATITVLLDGAITYRETTGAEGVLRTGGVEWMSAGNGVWHDGGPAEGESAHGFQLWLALPPEDENGPCDSRYLSSDQVPSVGPARIILGRHGAAASPIQPRASLSYLHVKLADGERWTYTPPAGHTVAWVAVANGALVTDTGSGRTTIGRELAVFEEGEAVLEFVAEGATEFVLGSAVKHPHDLVTGYYSVHTNAPALAQGEQEIQRIGKQLRAANLI